MRSVVVLTQLALWATTAHAFYPFTPKWLKEKLEKESKDARRSIEETTGTDGVSFAIRQRGAQSGTATPKQIAREALRLATKYNNRDFVNVDLETRQNQYDIVEAIDTDEENATGVHQDGSDYSYFITAGLGSKGKELHMLVDTGAGSTWVMGSDCTSEACTLHNSFGPDDSDSFEENGEEFTITYGSGRVKGILATDKVNVAGMSFDYKFGVASETSKDFVDFAFDGILGLSMNDGANDNFLKSIADADLVDANVFGVSLHRTADGTNDGEIKFGGVNKDKFRGEISYTSTSKDNGDWAIEIEEMAYNGKKAGVGSVPAYIDTGTTFIFGPQELVRSLHRVIPGAESSDGVSYKVPCDSKGPLTFTFSGVSYELASQDWISPQNDAGKCTSNIYGQEVVSGSWLLGAAFIKNVYAVFDKDKRRIGFAQHAEKSGPTTSASAPSTTTTKEQAESTGETESTDDATSSVTTAFSSRLPSSTPPTMGPGQESVEPSRPSSTSVESSEASGTADEDNDSSASSILPTSVLAACLGTIAVLLV